MHPSIKRRIAFNTAFLAGASAAALGLAAGTPIASIGAVPLAVAGHVLQIRKHRRFLATVRGLRLNGGREEIRTPGTPCGARLVSNQVPSTARPPVREAA